MGKKLLKKLIPALKKMEWPQTPEATKRGLEAYQIGLEQVSAYKNDPKQLLAALRTFQSGDSRPLAFAGAAYVLVAASRERDGTYAQEGLDKAMTWLERAQETEPDIVNVNMIEGLVYIFGGRLDDARLILDYLFQQDQHNYYLHVAEMMYWQKQGDAEKAALWYEEALKAAVNSPQRLRLRAQMGDFYLAQGILDKALVMFKEAAHFDKQNHVIWHKISLAFFQQGNLEEASRYNQRVLKLHDYQPARQLAAEIEKRLSPDEGLLGRLLGR